MNTLTKVFWTATAGYASLELVRHIVRRQRNFSWRGKRVVITGASRGLGLVIARQLADQGARLAICARTVSDLQRAAAELRGLGAEVFAAPCDVRDAERVDEFITQAIQRWGSVDVLINVAGIITVGPLDAMELSDFDDSMQTNCFGALRTTLAVLPAMRRQGWGRIVNVASIGGKALHNNKLPN